MSPLAALLALLPVVALAQAPAAAPAAPMEERERMFADYLMVASPVCPSSEGRKR